MGLELATLMDFLRVDREDEEREDDAISESSEVRESETETGISFSDDGI